MKNVLIALFLSSASVSAAWAQVPTEEETVTIVHAKKGEEPQQVMSALQKDFPGSIVQDVSTIPGNFYGQEWVVNEQNTTTNPADMQYYQVNASRKGMAYTAVYDKNGKLLSEREILKNTPLPAAAAENVAARFPGWQMVGDREKLTLHNQHNLVAYRVEIKKGKEEKKVFLNSNGQITRVARKIRVRV